jgi:hypothetical protein
MAPFPDCDGTHKRTHGKIGRHLHVWCSALTPLSSDRRYVTTKQCSTAFRVDFAGISLAKSSVPRRIISLAPELAQGTSSLLNGFTSRELAEERVDTST